MVNPPVVWLLQDPGIVRDLSSCSGYGEVITVLENHEQPSKDPIGCLARLREGLAEAQDGDYVLFAGGDPMTPLCAGVVLAELGIKNLHWLRWDRRTGGDGTRTRYGYYTPVKFLEPQPERSEA